MTIGQLSKRLNARVESGRPLRVGLVGAGKFGTMFLSQAARLAGLHVLGVADLSIERSLRALGNAGWPEERMAAKSAAEAAATGGTYVTQDVEELLRADGLELLIEATGAPAAGIEHALLAFAQGLHVVMVNVEADALAGPLLARRAARADVVYSLAYGDQPALICELVDWARVCGFEVVCAGKGTKYLPSFHASTPDTVWDHYGLDQETVTGGGLNPRMYNSFLDGTKSAIEMAAVANATGLAPQAEGLRFPPAGIERLANVCRPEAEGGQLAHRGTVEVVSSLERDGGKVAGDLRWGVFVTVAAPSDYVRRCLKEYGLNIDDSGNYAAMYRPYHLVGLELNVSVLKAGLLAEATGSPAAFIGDVAATAKRDLSAGERLDGEGGYCVYGRLLPAATSMRVGALPVGLASGVRLRRDVAGGEVVRWDDVDCDPADPAVRFRREMEAQLAS